MMAMVNGKPSFMNHLESGTVIKSESGNIWVTMKSISNPKGILVYSNDFDLTSDKDQKPTLGAYVAIYLAGSETLSTDRNGIENTSMYSFYAVNWGQNTNNKNPVMRNTRTESRGIMNVDTILKRFYLYGFGTGEYDFKLNTVYNWIAWD